MAVAVPEAPPVALSAVGPLQRRTLGLLVGTQIVGGVGVATGITVGALLVADLAGTKASGLSGSAAVIGAAVIAIPATRLMRSRGRRPGLAFAYLAGALGALVVTAGAALGSVALLFVGTFLFGGASAANLQARYVAADLARPDHRARHLSLVVWATTIGAVAGPNLAPLADDLAGGWGAPQYAGPYVFSAFAFGLTALAMLVFMRPDPLLTARALAAMPAHPTESTDLAGSADLAASAGTARASETAGGRGGVWREAGRAVRASPGARLGVAAVAVGHMVMVGVMSMTPVYIGQHGHHGADLLRLVGVVISLHVTGMYALSPVVGWLADRFGRRPVILGGIVVLLLACAVAGTSAENTPRLSVGMALLGLGWGCTMVAGSALLSESVSLEQRPGVQGLSDVVMGVAGASAGALSGVVVDFFGYPTLTLLAGIATVPLVALALRPVPVTRGGSGKLIGCG